MKTYVVSYRMKEPEKRAPLLAYGLRIAAADYARLDENVLLVHSRKTAEAIAGLLMPGLGADDELSVMEVGSDTVRYNAPIAWRSYAVAEL